MYIAQHRELAMMAPGVQTVHIIDDDEAVRDSLQAMLESEGLRVETFDSGQHFLDACAPGTQGCLLLDLNMPVMSGHDVLQAMTERSIDLPVIVITGVSDLRVKARALEAGARLLLEKPLEHQVLLDAIRRVIADPAAAG